MNSQLLDSSSCAQNADFSRSRERVLLNGSINKKDSRSAWIKNNNTERDRVNVAASRRKDKDNISSLDLCFFMIDVQSTIVFRAHINCNQKWSDFELSIDGNISSVLNIDNTIGIDGPKS